MPWGKKAEKLRLAYKWDTALLERMAGWPANTLARAIKHSRKIRIENAIKLARALNVPADWLFDDEHTGPPPPPPGPIDEQMLRARVLENMADALHAAAAQLAALPVPDTDASADPGQPSPANVPSPRPRSEPRPSASGPNRSQPNEHQNSTR